MATNYRNVNEAWPEPTPKPSPQEALAGARKLVRLCYKLAAEDKGWPKRPPRHYLKRRFKLTSGRRYNGPRSGVFYVNPTGHHFGGWRDIVHDISHWSIRLHWSENGNHTPRHAWLERTLAEHVVSSGWLEGKLIRASKQTAPPPDRKAVKQQRIEAKIARWQSKKRRAENALKKLARQRAYYDRQGAAA
jgi:hypothetical protein